jgi:hypothetical protein
MAMDNLIGGNLESESAFDQAVRERAYFLWEQAGKPEGRTQSFWDLAMDQHLRAHAYAQSCQDGGL